MNHEPHCFDESNKELIKLSPVLMTLVSGELVEANCQTVSQALMAASEGTNENYHEFTEPRATF